MICEEIKSKENVGKSLKEDVSDWLLLMFLEPVHYGFDQWNWLSESEDLTSKRHVCLKLLKPVLSVSVLRAAGCNNWHDEFDEILNESTCLHCELKQDGTRITLSLPS